MFAFLVSAFTGNAIVSGPNITVHCEHSYFNDSERGIRITNHENTLARCSKTQCYLGTSKYKCKIKISWK